MPIHKRIVTDGITSEIHTMITAPLALAELRALAEKHNRRATFDGFVADLERVCRQTLSERAKGHEPAAYGSRLWYAKEIVDQIGVTRHLLTQGRPDIAAAEAVCVGALAAEAKATHDWPLVQLGIKNRQSTQAAGRKRGKTIAKDAQVLGRHIRQTVDRYKASDDRLTIKKLAKNLDKNVITIQRHLKKMGLTLPPK